MQLIDAYRLAALRGAQQFLADHADRLARVAQTGACRRLYSILADLSMLVTEQAAATLQMRGATRRLHALRRRLMEDHLAPISSIARADLTRAPELAPFRLPRGTPSVERLAGIAHGMARAAAPHAAIFIEAGLPHDFLDRLDAAADAIIEARSARDACRNRVRAATAGIRFRLAEGRRIISVLDTFVRSESRDDDELRAAWLSVRAVPALPGRRRSRDLPFDEPSSQVVTARATLIAAPSPGGSFQLSRATLLLPSVMSEDQTRLSAGGTTAPAGD
jgi:hypothetical protein